MNADEPLSERLRKLDPQVPFFYGLGRFVSEFVNVERRFHVVFHRHSGLSEEVARALIGGLQLSRVTSALKVVFDAKEKAEERAEMKALIDQINAITKLRDALIHRGSDGEFFGEITITNEPTARLKESVEVLRISLQDLKDAIQDLANIDMRLIMLLKPSLKDEIPHNLYARMYKPWRFKHLEPENPYKPRRGGSR